MGKSMNGGISEVDSNEDPSLNGNVLSSVPNNPTPAEDASSRLSAIVDSSLTWPDQTEFLLAIQLCILIKVCILV